MSVRYPSDGDTEQIGKLIETGHPRLGFAAICVRQIKTVLVTAMVLTAAIYGPDRLPWLGDLVKISR